MIPTVSIIVPVYNAERTIRRCIESILNQEYTDFELLLVDDGSVDASGAICDEYAVRDSRVQVFHKANSGVSSSRNLALDRARGQFLQFLDSDDWITPDATRSLVRAMEDGPCDMVISDFYRVVGERVCQKGDIDEDGIMTREEFAAHMMEAPADFYYGVLWNKLYRRDIIIRHNLRMDESLSWCEDLLFNMSYYKHIASAYVLRTPVYYYVRSMTSLSMQKMNLLKLGRIRLKLYAAYRRFALETLTPGAYQAWKLRAVKFFYAGLIDEFVLPGSGGRIRNA